MASGFVTPKWNAIKLNCCKDGAFGLPNCLKTIIMVIVPFECILNTCSNVLITISRIIASIRHASCVRRVCILCHHTTATFLTIAKLLIICGHTFCKMCVLFVVCYEFVLSLCYKVQTKWHTQPLVSYFHLYHCCSALECKWVFPNIEFRSRVCRYVTW